MGYRALLKKYLSAVEAETGSLHLERLSKQATNRFTARDLGELRALAAELCRERPAVACSRLPREGGHVMSQQRATILAEGLHFGEGPRWHEGYLYFSDMHAHALCRWREGEAVEVAARFEGPISGLGWQPDGTLLVVSMLDKQVLRSDGTGAFTLHADLSGLVPERCNDMVVDAEGGAYVGNFGFDLHGGGTPQTTVLCYVPRAGAAASIAAENVAFPNGAVITPDGKTLILGESMGRCLTAFTIAAPGQLRDRRVFAQFPEGRLPDGICLDAAGGVWAASPTGDECLRLEDGGRVTHRVAVSQGAYACMLGGEEEKTLYILTAADSDPTAPAGSGRIEAAPAPYPRAGLP